MSEERTFRRGDVVLVSFPYVTDPSRTKLRPAVIVQNDVGNQFSPNLIIAAISSQLPIRQYPTNMVLRQDSPAAEGAGLGRDSVVQAEVILTIPKASVAKRLGRFNDEAMRAIDQCLKVSLGLT